MTLDRRERERREYCTRMASVYRDKHPWAQWLREAHTRIEELEEALHAREAQIIELEKERLSWRVILGDIDD